MRIGRLGVGSAIIGGVLGITAMVAIGIGVTSNGVFAQTPSPTPTPGVKAERNADYLTALAGQLGITVDRLKAANLAAQNQLVDQALAAGRITAEQATAAKDRLAEAGGAHLGPHFGHKMHRGPGARAFGLPGIRGLASGTLDSVTAYLGIDKATLMREIGAGKSLAQIATEHGKTRDGLKAAITQGVRQGVDSADFQTMLDRIIDATPGQRIERPANAPTGSGT